jgi:predicted nucleic acid-binding protein
VLIEAHALIMSTLGIQEGIRFLQDLPSSKMTVIRVRGADEEAARRLIFQYDDKAFSWTDAISFVVMSRLGIRFAFTFDRHFEQYGLVMLTHGTQLS